MTCEKSDCEKDDNVQEYETSGPPEGTFSVELCDACAPTATHAATSD